jgi:hypothetical protein
VVRGLKPLIREIATAETRADLDALEKHHIQLAKSSGARLTNHTNGGVGPSGWKHTEEWKQRMSLLFTGRPGSCTAEQYKRMADATRGSTRSLETRARISAAKMGTPSPNRGVPMSEDQKAKVSASRTGKLLGASHHQFRADISTDYILHQLCAGYSKVQVAAELGVSNTFIHRRLAQAKKVGWEIPPRGKQVPMEKVLVLREEGATLVEISRIVSVSPASLCRALRKKRG